MMVEASSSKPTLLVIEAAVSLLSLSLAFALPNLASRQFSSVERFLGRLASRRVWMLVTIGLLACVLRLALLPIIPIPQPYVHDEFSYLLAADTFASGRLTNPTHPMWQHFESFHISHVPTYMSMYFPAQGMFLAAGKVLFGHPWFGVLLSSGIFCSVLYWMLAGWLPSNWALFGSLLAVARLSLFSNWVNAYHGGFVAAIGGALVLGALPRLKRSVEIRNTLSMAVGFIILANSRPFEGVLVSIPVVAMLVWWKARVAPLPWQRVARRSAVACGLLVLAFCGMAYYNHRLFGSAFTIPYQLNRLEYASAPHFLWQKPRPLPVYRHKAMEEFYTNLELSDFNNAKTITGFIAATAQKLGITLFFVFGWTLAPPLLLLPRAIGDRRIRYLICAAIFLAIGLCCNAWLFPHYLAPFIAGIYVILLQCMRHLRACGSGDHKWGTAMVRAIAVSVVLLTGIRIAAPALGIMVERWPTSWHGTEPLGLQRAAVKSQLESQPGKQLVLVRYGVHHVGKAVADEWVYNDADIDGSKVVWAREMDPGNNAELLRYFSDRRVWIVEPDAPFPKPLSLTPEDLTLLSRGSVMGDRTRTKSN